MENSGRILTVKDLAEYLRVHTSTIYRLLKTGAIPGFKVGSDWRFNIETVDAWRLGKLDSSPGNDELPADVRKQGTVRRLKAEQG